MARRRDLAALDAAIVAHPWEGMLPVRRFREAQERKLLRVIDTFMDSEQQYFERARTRLLNDVERSISNVRSLALTLTETIAMGDHMPVHLGAMGESVRVIARDNIGRMQPGDVYMLNNPYHGGTHLPDVTVITPVHGPSGERLAYVASRAHHAEIGGIRPGCAAGHRGTPCLERAAPVRRPHPRRARAPRRRQRPTRRRRQGVHHRDSPRRVAAAAAH